MFSQCSSEKSPRPKQFQFSSIFCIFEPFPAVTVWFWDPSFHTEDNLETQARLKKGSKIHWCSRNKTRCIKGMKTFEQHEDLQIFLILFRNPFYSALRKQEKIDVSCMEDKKVQLPISKKFSLWKVFLSGALVNVSSIFNSCVSVPPLYSVWKDGSKAKSYSHCKGFKYAKEMLENRNNSQVSTHTVKVCCIVIVRWCLLMCIGLLNEYSLLFSHLFCLRRLSVSLHQTFV